MEAESRDHFGLVGTHLEGKYRVEAVVGEGGFGIVYRATHEGFDAPVAIKCLKLPPYLDHDAQEALVVQLRDEGRLLLRLSQRTAGIVQALDIGTWTTQAGLRVPYLVLEWLEGRTLASDLRRRRDDGAGGRSLGDAFRLLSPAVSALAIAHAENIAHRDIKPENLMIVGSAGASTIKVLDFGIAKVLEEASTARDAKTSSAAPVLSPGYAAPEQFEKSRGASGPWSDVFALALVFIELVTGKRAFASGTFMDVYRATVDPDARPTLGSGGVDSPALVDDVLDRALHVEPRSRYADAGRFWAALEEAIRESAPQELEGEASVADDTGMSTAEFVMQAGLATDPTSGASSQRLERASASTSSRSKRQGANVKSGQRASKASTSRSSEEAELGSAQTERATTRGPVVASIDEPRALPITRRGGPLFFAGLLAIVGVGAYFFLARGERPDDGAGELAAALPPAASGSSAPVASAESPVSPNPEAVTLFREALEAWRGGSPDAAIETLDQVVKLDRSVAAGHLRLALWKLSRKPADAREHYEMARRHAAALSPRDAGLLEAIAPLMAAPPDPGGYASKIEALAERHPAQAELWALLSQARNRLLLYDEAFAAADRALAIDPKHVASWVFRGDAQSGKGDSTGRLQSYEKCVAEVPGALECLHKLVALRSALGQCPAMLEDAKSFATVGPKSARAQRYLAVALHAAGADREAVLEAFQRAWSLQSARERAVVEPRDRATLAILDGDFQGALGLLEESSLASAKETDQSPHLEPAVAMLDLEREMGRPGDAASRAERLSKKMVAWAEPSTGDWTLTLDRFRLLAGRMTPEEFGTNREAWSAKVRGKWAKAGRKIDGELEWTLWVTGYGTVVIDDASASAAVAKMPQREVVALVTGRFPVVDAIVGRAHVRAGDAAAARAPLERAVGNCSFALTDPVLATAAWYDLGLALEAAGEKDRAKEAFGRVVARWGKAKPVSVTAKAAAARLTALGK